MHSPHFRLRSRAGERLAALPPHETRQRRDRGRRGGPRTPLPLLALIAAVTGVGIAYVSQTAHATQTTYDATALIQTQQQLTVQDQQLGDRLGQLLATEKIITQARRLGMVEGGTWLYATATPEQVVPSPAAEVVDASKQQTTDSAVAQLIGVLSGAFVGTPAR
jgi:hypothetical protein